VTAAKSWWTPIKVGLVLTAIVVICFVAMAAQRNCILLESTTLECRSNWAWFRSSKPNEIGDALAGFAGTLAFIWIVVTVWLQSTELAEQREVLREQKEEFKLMVSAQNAQVKALEAHAAIFADEKIRRDQKEAKELYEQYLVDICRGIRFLNKESIHWYFPDPRDRPHDLFGSGYWLFTIKDGVMDTEENINAFHRNVRVNLLKLQADLSEKKNVKLPRKPPALTILIKKLQAVCDLQTSMAAPEIQRVNRMTTPGLCHILRLIESDNGLWESSEEGEQQ
jgi:hypothetical protein